MENKFQCCRLLCLLALAVVITKASGSASDADQVAVESTAVTKSAGNQSHIPPELERNEYYLYEPFRTSGLLGKTWFVSNAKGGNGRKKSPGEWKIEQGTMAPLKDDFGLVLKSMFESHAIAARMEKSFDFNDDTLVLQFDVKFQNGQVCGGGYVQLLSAGYEDNDLSLFSDKTPHTIAFGPETCNGISQLHFNINLRNRVTGKLEHKCCSTIPTELHKSIFGYMKDQISHLYTLVLKADNLFSIYVDRNLVHSGSLLLDFEPPVNSPKQIQSDNGVVIRDPNHIENLKPFQNLAPVSAIGIELWSQRPNTMFDNLLVTSDKNVADRVAASTWALKASRERTEIDRWRMEWEERRKKDDPGQSGRPRRLTAILIITSIVSTLFGVTAVHVTSPLRRCKDRQAVTGPALDNDQKEEDRLPQSDDEDSTTTDDETSLVGTDTCTNYVDPIIMARSPASKTKQQNLMRKTSPDCSSSAGPLHQNVNASIVSRRDAWFVIGGYKTETQFLQFDTLRRTWSTLPALPWPRTQSGACFLGDRIVVMGGAKSCDVDAPATADIDEYKLSTGAWTTSNAKLSQPHEVPAVCSDGHSAYVFGGLTTNSLVERYSVGAKSTKMMADLNVGRCELASAYANQYDAIFIAGGCDADQEDSPNVPTIEKYDISNDTWTVVGKTDAARYGPATVLLGDDLYILGGVDEADVESDVVEVFNINNGKTTRSAPKLLDGRCSGSATALDSNTLCVIGGENQYDYLRSVEVLDVREGKWTTGSIVPDMPSECAFFGFVSV